ncbi:uncharacterized protein BHQ10_006734 [Talaromyces amestolkiae]|uniref:Cysteine-rich transmembrane CYSTM domain-containing protein n=1 Tax=Talaromyces amestolkiae TaxID=1196081 RepID=A0A364L4K0_TALAM|nr:uncharacterized protein BHQ10_006734 [Talaromyces amestolkiae]RAO70722.1 hypothetical protein BHQ10_006734 [Talaromyces amestolkiae]
MFQNGFFGLFKSSQQEEEPRTQQVTWNASTMAMEQPASYAGSQQTAAPSQEEQQMKLRGGAGCCDVCCGCFAGLCAFECLEDCC